MAQVKSVAEVYKSVVNDVIEGVKEAFFDEGLDDQMLLELKQIWETKLKQSKALEGSSIADTSRAPPPAHSHHQAKIIPQHLILNNAVSNTNITAANQAFQSLQATPVLNLGASQLSQSAQTATQSLPPNVLQHINNIGYMVPRGTAHRPILIQPQLAGTSFIQTQTGGVIFGLSDQPIATSATPQNSVTLDTTGRNIVQLDGLEDSLGDTSSEEEDNEDETKQKEENEDVGDGGEEVEDDPLNSDDDTSDNDAQDLFDVDNVVVCQFDKINRSKAKWKFHLKDGIMNLNGRDHIFQKATGDAEF